MSEQKDEHTAALAAVLTGRKWWVSASGRLVNGFGADCLGRDLAHSGTNPDLQKLAPMGP